MLKCGQRDNKTYTFGIGKEQIKEGESKKCFDICCGSCGTCLTIQMKFCPSCGEKL